MQNKTTIYTDTQRAYLSDLLSEAKQQGKRQTTLVFATVTTPHGTTFGASFNSIAHYLQDKKVKRVNGHGYTMNIESCLFLPCNK